MGLLTVIVWIVFVLSLLGLLIGIRKGWVPVVQFKSTKVAVILLIALSSIILSFYIGEHPDLSKVCFMFAMIIGTGLLGHAGTIASSFAKSLGSSASSDMGTTPLNLTLIITMVAAILVYVSMFMNIDPSVFVDSALEGATNAVGGLMIGVLSALDDDKGDVNE